MTSYAKHATSIKLLFGLLPALFLLCGSQRVFAELISVQLDGAQEVIHLDLEKGVLYIGNDCSPFLYFTQTPSNRGKGDNARVLTVSQSKSRSAIKSGIAPRLPSSIILDGDSVEIVTRTVKGTSNAKGKSGSAQSIMAKASRGCKD